MIHGFFHVSSSHPGESHWINLNHVICVSEFRHDNELRINIKFNDSTNIMVSGESAKDLSIALSHLSINDFMPDKMDVYSAYHDHDFP